MALTQFESTGIFIDKTLVTAKTAVVANARETEWSFQVLCDGAWFRASFTTLALANAAWATYT